MGKRTFGNVRRLPSGRWQVRYPDRLTRRLIPAPATFATKADANAWLASVQSGKIHTGSISKTNRDIRFADYAEECLSVRALEPRTAELYAGHLAKHINPYIGDAILVKIEPRDIREWHSKLRKSESIGATTVAKVYRLVRSIFNTAIDDELLDSNPCKIRGAGKESSKERKIPPSSSIRLLANEVPERYSAVIWIAALAGLRKGEIFGLQRKHVNLEEATIRVEQALQEQTGKGAVLKSTKEISGSNSDRVVGMPSLLVIALNDHLRRFTASEPDSFVFTNTQGRPVRRSVWGPAWTDARNELGLKYLHLHDLRHLAGTLTALSGATLKETMERLGHSSPRAALRYQHVAKNRDHEIAKGIDDLL